MDWHRCNHLNDRIIWYWKKKLDLVNQLNGWKQLTPKTIYQLNTYYLPFEKSCLRQSTTFVVFHLQTPFTTEVVGIVICNNTEYLIKPSLSIYRQPSGEFYWSFTVFTTYWSVIKIGVILRRTWKIFCIIVRKM